MDSNQDRQRPKYPPPPPPHRNVSREGIRTTSSAPPPPNKPREASITRDGQINRGLNLPPLPPPRNPRGSVPIVQQSDVTQEEIQNLFNAVNKGDYESVCHLIDNSSDGRVLVNSSSAMGLTPLMYAVQLGHIAIAKLLINNGAELEALSGFMQTPLALAVMQDKKEMVRLLLSFGAAWRFHPDTDNIAVVGHTTPDILCALSSEMKLIFQESQYQSKPRSMSITKPLTYIFNGASRTVVSTLYGSLEQAAKEGNTELITRLVNSGSKVNITDGSCPALVAAVENEQLEAVKLLLKKGANPNTEDKDESSGVVYTAIKQQQTQIAYELAKYGANFILHPAFKTVTIGSVFNEAITVEMYNALKNGRALYDAMESNKKKLT